uniref:SET domain-containing protein n=2 Tax=Magnaporthiopsis poae (strain ATCC 64411 / 73-15) TaxID=644358 RepID=A0A0C4E007_MAGP6
MDVPDASGDEHWRAVMRQFEDAAKQARAQKGRIPPARLPVLFQVVQFNMATHARAAKVAAGDKYMLATTCMPPPYPACVHPADELEPIMISEMRLETQHRGRRALVRVLTPPDRMNAIMTIVEDEEGSGAMLQLYNQPPESEVPAAETVRMHRVAIIKEPFFKGSAAGNNYNLRVDHVSDIMWLDETDPRVPSEWRASRSVTDSQVLRTRGNDAVKRCCFAEAERLYSSALQAAKTAGEKNFALLNRSHASLKLGRFEHAFADAVAANQIGNPSEKGLFREARALYELARFSECLAKFQELASAFPGNEAVKSEIKRTQRRLREQKTGDFDFSQMLKQAKVTPPIIDCATFVGPVEIRDSPGRGRGLFATKKVKAGQLLVCEKAFGYGFVGDEVGEVDGRSQMTVLIDLNSRRVTVGGQAQLIPQIVQRLYNNPQSSRAFEDLHKGDYQPAAGPGVEADGKPVVDTFLVAKIVALNSFGCQRTSWDYHKQWIAKSRAGDHKKSSDRLTCGFWIHASYINHSCIESCSRSYIGDVQIIRASRDLEPGTELVFRYSTTTDHTDTYAETQAKLRHWGFECGCAMCIDKKSSPSSSSLTGPKAATLRSLRERLAKRLSSPGLSEAGVP